MSKDNVSRTTNSRLLRSLFILILIHQALLSVVLVVLCTAEGGPNAEAATVGMPVLQKLGLYWNTSAVPYGISVVFVAGWLAVVGCWRLLQNAPQGKRLLGLYAACAAVFVALDISASLVLASSPPVSFGEGAFQFQKTWMLDASVFIEPLLATLPGWIIMGATIACFVHRKSNANRSSDAAPA